MNGAVLRYDDVPTRTIGLDRLDATSTVRAADAEIDRTVGRAGPPGNDRRSRSTERHGREPDPCDRHHERSECDDQSTRGRGFDRMTRIATLDVGPQVGRGRARERREPIAELRHRRRPPGDLGAGAGLASGGRGPRPRSNPRILATSRAGYPAPSWRTTEARCRSDRAPSATIRSRAGTSISYEPSVVSTSLLRRCFNSPAATRKAVRQTHRSGSRTSSPRRRTCANASATASLATSGSPANARSPRQIRSPRSRYRRSIPSTRETPAGARSTLVITGCKTAREREHGSRTTCRCGAGPPGASGRRCGTAPGPPRSR